MLKVRNTANDSQNQHLKTHGLVREYQGTALHVVDTMIPLIELGIKKKVTLNFLWCLVCNIIWLKAVIFIWVNPVLHTRVIVTY